MNIQEKGSDQTMLHWLSFCCVQVQGDSVQNTLAMQKMEMPHYLTLFSPALDWILQCLAHKAPDTLLNTTLDKCKHDCNKYVLQRLPSSKNTLKIKYTTISAGTCFPIQSISFFLLLFPAQTQHLWIQAKKDLGAMLHPHSGTGCRALCAKQKTSQLAFCLQLKSSLFSTPSHTPILLNRVISHQGGLYQGGLSPGWSVIRMVFHQVGLSSGWSLISMVSHQGGLSSGWSLTMVVFKQG